MDKKQSGFTLIELVMVIVILGILAAVAIPKFVDLSTQAELAAAKGVAGGISSAFATNYAAFAAGGTGTASVSGGTVNISTVAGGILQGGWPANYALSPTSAACGTVTGTGGSAGVAANFTVYYSVTTSSNSATATLICTG